MALALVSFVLQNLNSLIQKEVGLLWGVDKEMKKLSSTLSTIEAVIQDAELKQIQSKSIENWLRKLKDAAYELDDLLDECTTKALRREFESQSSSSLKKVGASLLTCYPVENILFRHKIGNRMKEITENLDAIAEERMKFHLREEAVEKQVDLAERRETSSALTQPEIYGRDEDREKIVKMSVEDACDCQGVSVCTIIGIGGLGKTTLAQMVINDERVRSHFELKSWVYVSQDFNVKRVLKAIISSISDKPCEASDLDSLHRKLREMLYGKRYLLVLDDMWDEDQEKWEPLKYALASGSKGSFVIVTTRSEKVASITGTLPPHHLSFLSEDDCWLLFRQRAFGHENEERPNLVAIGKEIVKKCGGVPLAAKTLGGLMRFKCEEKEWLSIKESEVWNLTQDGILATLRLSYLSLPLELRRCFAYCSIFPKGHEIKKETLIKLWMANGFISCSGNQQPEVIGDQIWRELYLRSLFQDAEENDNVRWTWLFEVHDVVQWTTWFKMHDLVHDLSRSVMEDECQMIELKSSSNTSIQKARHVTLVAKSTVDIFPNIVHKAASLRTFRIQYPRLVNKLRPKSEFFCDFKKFSFLRAFDARMIEMKKVPSSIGNVKHLRYLDISGTQIKKLPNSICSLWNLQTLILDMCRNLRRLPKNMTYLRSLRHLYLSGCQLIDMPPNIGQLTCLRTLTLFVVGNRRGCDLSQLNCLNLGGELRITHLERVRNVMDAKEADLMGKQDLGRLELCWEDNAECLSQENVEQLLDALEPHPNLKALAVRHYRGTQLPLWIRDSRLQNLLEIRLTDCKNCLQLPPFGRLPLLKSLEIGGMDSVEYVENDFPNGASPVRGFPALEGLSVYGLLNLKGLSRVEGRELFPRLRKMHVSDCPKLSFPCLPSLKVLEVRSNCSNVVLTSISNLPNLSHLFVEDNKEAVSFPEEVLANLTVLEELFIWSFTKLTVFPKDLANLAALRTLYIASCPDLESLTAQDLRSLESLQRLNISDCGRFSSISEGLRHLTGLVYLTFVRCPVVEALPEDIKHLHSLQSLTIAGGPKLVALPEVLQHVTTLQTLNICDFPSLTSLPDWFGNLTSLRSLFIRNCRKITSLPACIRSLANLQRLHVAYCNPELKRRCKKEKGEDWNNIERIPDVDVFAYQEDVRSRIKRLCKFDHQ